MLLDIPMMHPNESFRRALKELVNKYTVAYGNSLLPNIIGVMDDEIATLMIERGSRFTTKDETTEKDEKGNRRPKII